MKFRTTLIAALILSLMGCYLYFFEYKKVQEEKAQAEKEKKVISADWAKVRGLKVASTHGTGYGDS